ncbi:hypothetical protein EI546_00200 [Aequorivita sp. H23M31]|uniref:TerB family tellurite resistance protein n=1 Tax=Aequorivita ciconiae TaxID=2494375 RepID=A0A451FS89_9FLAO|nr:hypothetical protein [Aequorivita sp. H23M31]QAA80247.1 hypothetical protein EI546_00200 [Aequorivita sp. H23M31]
MEKNPKSLLSDLIIMIKADGVIRPSEIELIQKLANRLGISNEEIAELFTNPQPSQALYSEVDRITHFYRLALMMQVDKESHKSEVTALKNFGLKMGIRPIVADQIIKKMEQYNGGVVPPEELLRIFKIYYN